MAPTIYRLVIGAVDRLIDPLVGIDGERRRDEGRQPGGTE